MCVSFLFMHAPISTKVTDEDTTAMTAATTGGSSFASNIPGWFSVWPLVLPFTSTVMDPARDPPQTSLDVIWNFTQQCRTIWFGADIVWKRPPPPPLPPLLFLLSMSSPSLHDNGSFCFSSAQKGLEVAHGCVCHAACVLVGKGVSGVASVRRGRIQK